MTTKEYIKSDIITIKEYIENEINKEYIKRELRKLKQSKDALKVKIIDSENNQTNYINLNRELIKQLKTL